MSEDRLELVIAGIHTAMEIADPPMRAWARGRYAEFLTEPSPAAGAVRVQVVTGARFLEFRPGPLRIETSVEGSRLTYRSYVDAGWFDLETGDGSLQLAPEIDVENFLRVVYAHQCLRHRGLLLHAASVIRNGQGYVFFGASGSGKTTAARLSLQNTVLSDDLAMVGLRDDGWKLFGVPFHGQFADAPPCNAVAPLAGVFALSKAEAHLIEPLERADAVQQLVACVPFVMQSPVRAKQVLDLCAALATQVPTARLFFRRDPGFWEVVDEARLASSPGLEFFAGSFRDHGGLP